MRFQKAAQSQVVRQCERTESTVSHESEDLGIRGLDVRGYVSKDLSPCQRIDGEYGERDSLFP